LAPPGDRGLVVTLPSDAHEEPGLGIRGRVEGRLVALGRERWVAPEALDPSDVEGTSDAGTTSVYVAIDGQVSGVLRLARSAPG